jgi:hypothetical protein
MYTLSCFYPKSLCPSTQNKIIISHIQNFAQNLSTVWLLVNQDKSKILYKTCLRRPAFEFIAKCKQKHFSECFYQDEKGGVRLTTLTLLCFDNWTIISVKTGSVTHRVLVNEVRSRIVRTWANNDAITAAVERKLLKSCTRYHTAFGTAQPEGPLTS